MDYLTLIEVFRNNQIQKGLLVDRLTYSDNPLHRRDILACSEMINKAIMVFHEVSERDAITPSDFNDSESFLLRNQVYQKEIFNNNSKKTIVYVFHHIPSNTLTTEVSQCLGTLNSPNVFGSASPLNLQGLLLNIFEVVNSNFIFPSWCNVFYINGKKNRAIPNIALSSIESQLSNSIDFFPDAIETLKSLYSIQLSNIELNIEDVFIKT